MTLEERVAALETELARLTTQPKPLLTSAEAAELLGLNVDQFYRRLNAGDIPAEVEHPLTIGQRHRRKFSRRAVLEFIDTGRVTPLAVAPPPEPPRAHEDGLHSPPGAATSVGAAGPAAQIGRARPFLPSPSGDHAA